MSQAPKKAKTPVPSPLILNPRPIPVTSSMRSILDTTSPTTPVPRAFQVPGLKETANVLTSATQQQLRTLPVPVHQDELQSPTFPVPARQVSVIDLTAESPPPEALALQTLVALKEPRHKNSAPPNRRSSSGGAVSSRQNVPQNPNLFTDQNIASREMLPLSGFVLPFPRQTSREGFDQIGPGTIPRRPSHDILRQPGSNGIPGPPNNRQLVYYDQQPVYLHHGQPFIYNAQGFPTYLNTKHSRGYHPEPASGHDVRSTSTDRSRPMSAADQPVKHAKHLPGVIPTQYAGSVMSQVPHTNMNERRPSIQHRQEARLTPGNKGGFMPGALSNTGPRRSSMSYGYPLTPTMPAQSFQNNSKLYQPAPTHFDPLSRTPTPSQNQAGAQRYQLTQAPPFGTPSVYSGLPTQNNTPQPNLKLNPHQLGPIAKVTRAGTQAQQLPITPLSSCFAPQSSGLTPEQFQLIARLTQAGDNEDSVFVKCLTAFPHLPRPTFNLIKTTRTNIILDIRRQNQINYEMSDEFRMKAAEREQRMAAKSAEYEQRMAAKAEEYDQMKAAKAAEREQRMAAKAEEYEQMKAAKAEDYEQKMAAKARLKATQKQEREIKRKEARERQAKIAEERKYPLSTDVMADIDARMKAAAQAQQSGDNDKEDEVAAGQAQQSGYNDKGNEVVANNGDKAEKEGSSSKRNPADMQPATIPSNGVSEKATAPSTPGAPTKATLPDSEVSTKSTLPSAGISNEAALPTVPPPGGMPMQATVPGTGVPMKVTTPISGVTAEATFAAAGASAKPDVSAGGTFRNATPATLLSTAAGGASTKLTVPAVGTSKNATPASMLSTAAGGVSTKPTVSTVGTSKNETPATILPPTAGSKSKRATLPAGRVAKKIKTSLPAEGTSKMSDYTTNTPTVGVPTKRTLAPARASAKPILPAVVETMKTTASSSKPSRMSTLLADVEVKKATASASGPSKQASLPANEPSPKRAAISARRGARRRISSSESSESSSPSSHRSDSPRRSTEEKGKTVRQIARERRASPSARSARQGRRILGL